MHELVHLDIAVQCRKKNANYLFVSTKEQKERFIRDNESIIQQLNRDGFDDNSISGFINSLFNGMNSQIYNNPVDLFIEEFLFKTYPELRPCQFISLYSLLQDYIKAATSKKIIEYTPAIVRNANIILSLVHSFQFKDLYGYETSNLFNATHQQMRTAKGFYDEYRKYLKNDMALEAHQLIQKWAKDLKIENYFTIIDENEYRRSKPDTYSFIEEFHNIPTLAAPPGLLSEKGGKGGFSDFQSEPAGQMARLRCWEGRELILQKPKRNIISKASPEKNSQDFSCLPICFQHFRLSIRFWIRGWIIRRNMKRRRGCLRKWRGSKLCLLCNLKERI
ncbi:MAG: hypothetical protein HY757_00850 [Nitrospirae bacterium]|nr:hypothetical protein [Nitrospirota bacterium]